MPSDPTALYEKLLERTEPLKAGEQYTAAALRAPVEALRSVVKLHQPELFGGVTSCLACSPGMPPPLLVEWPCSTISSVAEALGVSLDG